MESCPVCSLPFKEGDLEQTPYPSGKRQRGKDQLPAKIRFCSNCGAGVASPPISVQLADELYARGDYWKQSNRKTSLKIFPVPYGLAQARWRLIERSVGQGNNGSPVKLLDIGAGHGYLGLVACLSSKMEVSEYHAVEPDSVMRQYMHDIWAKRGCKQKLNIMTSADEAVDKYDLVVLSHVLEHVQDPGSFLRSARILTSKGGLLFIDVPNQDHLFKSDVFPHNIFFSVSSLKNLLETESLEVISVGVWGRSRYKSPSYANAPRSMRLIGRTVKMPGRFLPAKILVGFYAWYFGMNDMNADGTWMRVLCRVK